MSTTKQSKGLTRDTLDKYYTSLVVVQKCMKEVMDLLDINTSDDLCIEPSAGNGAFISSLKKVFKNSHFYDIEPEHPEVTQQDYLSLIYDFKVFRKVHVIGNPPFGRQSSIAIKFIKKSCEFADSVSFILPRSFKKESMKKHFPCNFHLIYECDIPDDSFLVDGKTHNVPCVFQIWEYREEMRIIAEKLTPNGYAFVKQNEDPDISFRRVGGRAGELSYDTQSKSHQSHYFIKFENGISEKILKKLEAIDYPCKNNTVGARSISKQELIKEFNVIL